MLEHKKLRTELEVFYSREYFRNIVGAFKMFSWLKENDLNKTFSETVKLFNIIVITSMSITKSERLFFTLKRFLMFLRNMLMDEHPCITNAKTYYIT